MTRQSTNYVSDAVEALGRGWNRFWFTPADPLPGCVLRIGVGLLAIAHFASLGIDLERWYGKNGLLEMRYVSGLEPVNVGDYVVTTGQDGIYPPGLNVGTVVQKTEGSATTPHTIYVKPGARLDSLEEVAVLQYRPPPRTAPERTLPNVDKGRK